MPDTTVILVRHGETEWNRQGRWQGHADSPLTATGRAQAAAIARRLAGAALDHLYTSDLGRAAATADIIAAATGHTPVADARLRERCLGICQGLTRAEMAERHPELHARMRSMDPSSTIPEGESRAEAYARSTAALQELAARHPGARLGIVTHGGVLDHCFRFVCELPLEQARRWQLLNAAYQELVHDGEHWQVRTWGDVTHLVDAASMDDADSRA